MASDPHWQVPGGGGRCHRVGAPYHDDHCIFLTFYYWFENDCHWFDCVVILKCLTCLGVHSYYLFGESLPRCCRVGHPILMVNPFLASDYKFLVVLLMTTTLNTNIRTILEASLIFENFRIKYYLKKIDGFTRCSSFNLHPWIESL